MPLYAVDVELRYVVVADDVDHAENVAEGIVGEVAEQAALVGTLMPWIVRVDKPADLPVGWRETDYPWGEDGARTIAAVLATEIEGGD